MSSSRGGGVEVKDWTEEEGGQWLGLGGGAGGEVKGRARAWGSKRRKGIGDEGAQQDVKW